MSKKGEKLVKFITEDLKSVDEKTYEVEAIISTEQEDRHGEKVIQSGWDTSEYETNPVVLFSHDNERPIGKAVALNVGEKATTARIQFAVEENPEVKSIWNMVKGGYLKGISVGFINDLREGNELLKNTLLEISLVAVPANAGAFILAVENGTINKKDALWLKQSMEREIKMLDKKIKSTENDDKLADLLVTLNSTISELKESVNTLAEKLEVKEDEPSKPTEPTSLADAPEDKEESDTSDDSDKDEPSEDLSGADDEVDEDNLTDEQAEQVAEAVSEALNEEGEPNV